ncbi:MAG: hypothetical protein K9M99_03670 [Candidatus Cloacimonetes bacterium]|nr:hypothetical protein [Candidatus Cloacimonadota bacterium]
MIIKRRCDMVYEALKSGNITQVVSRREYFEKLLEQLLKNDPPKSKDQLKMELMRYFKQEIDSDEYVIESNGDLPLDEMMKWQADEDVDCLAIIGRVV